MAAYSFLLILLPSRMLRPVAGWGTIGPNARPMLIVEALSPRGCPCSSPPMPSPPHGDGLRLKTCLSVWVQPSMIRNVKFRPRDDRYIYIYIQGCACFPIVFSVSRNNKRIFNGPKYLAMAQFADCLRLDYKSTDLD